MPVPLYLLAVAIFAMGTSEFMLGGLTPDLVAAGRPSGAARRGPRMPAAWFSAAKATVSKKKAAPAARPIRRISPPARQPPGPQGRKSPPIRPRNSGRRTRYG